MDGSIQKYLAFVKTVECGSFTRAAGVLNYSQSGISRMIGDLEREWQVTLLERGKSGVRLTSEGTRLLPYAKRVCSEYEKLQAEVDEINGLKSGLIRIGTFSSVATHWLPNIIREFQKEYPGIDYELILGDYTEIETWIEEGRVDCGFLRLPARKELESVFLEQDRLLVSQVTLDADQQELIRHRLNALRSGQWVTVTYNKKEKELEGILLGEYVIQTGKVRRVDDFYQVLALDSGVVAFENIRELEINDGEGVEAV